MSREEGAWLCIFSHKTVAVALKGLRSANAKYHVIYSFSLACLGSETHNLQRVLLRIYGTKLRGVIVPGIHSGDRGNWE